MVMPKRRGEGLDCAWVGGCQSSGVDQRWSMVSSLEEEVVVVVVATIVGPFFVDFFFLFLCMLAGFLDSFFPFSTENRQICFLI